MTRRHRNMRRKPMFAPLLLPITAFALVALGVAWFFDSQATTTMILVGHAETESEQGALTEQGRARAELLARTLIDVDVIRGLDAIYAVPLRAANETARPLAERLDLPVLAADDPELSRMMDALVDRHKGKVVLVVARAQQLPEMSAELGGHQSAPTVADGEYTNLYILSIPWFGKTKTLRLHYGLPMLDNEDAATGPDEVAEP